MRVCAETGEVPSPPNEEIGKHIIEYMRKRAPRGAEKPWRTAKNVRLARRAAEAIGGADDLIAYLDDCARLVEMGKQAARWWQPRYLLAGKGAAWWLGEVGELRAREAEREAWELDRAARAEREAIAREAERVEARRASMRMTPDPELRQAAEPVVQRARAQELAASVLARLEGERGVEACPACQASVAASERRCPACGQELVDASGARRRGLRRAGVGA